MQVKKSDFLLSFQMGEVWNELQPKLGCLFGGNNGLKPPIWNRHTPGGGTETLPLTRITNWKITCSVSYRKKPRMHNYSPPAKSSVARYTFHSIRGFFNVNGFSTYFGFDHQPCMWKRQWAHKSAISCSAWWGNNFHFQIKEGKSSKCYKGAVSMPNLKDDSIFMHSNSFPKAPVCNLTL